MQEFFLAGTYSEPILFGTGELFCGKGKGIYLCEFDGETVKTISQIELGNPSFLTVDEDRQRIYAVNEMKEYKGTYGGGITELRYDAAGRMEIVTELGTEGADPCHVALSPDKRLLGVANFADGVVSMFRLDETGALQKQREVFRHQGRSAHPIRQTGPHAHSVIFTGDGRIFVPDLGMDQLVCYDCGQGGVKADPARTVPLPPGSGPRFGEFSPNGEQFYLINELGSSVTRFLWDGDRMHMQETVSTLPDDFDGENICSDLHITPGGRFLYASNRGHDSISAYTIDPEGRLHFLDRVSCQGKTPRNFALDPTGQYLLVGNQDSDTIAVFRVESSGRLTFIKNNAFPTPACIRFFHRTSF